MKKPLVIITGPTCVGKTAISIELCSRIGGSVISADSMQVYKGMDIGTAKIRPEETAGIPHYLIDEYEPEEEFNVAEFKEKAGEYVKMIYDEGRIPVIVGGTGFYIQALLYDVDFTETREDKDFRQHLVDIAANKGNVYLHEMLREIDPDAADAIHSNNVKRVIRALEYQHLTGELISEHNKAERAKESPYNFAYFVLNDDRKLLYEKIDKRIDIMLEQGLVDEVKALKDKGLTRDHVSMKGLGYKEILTYLEGECSLEEAVYVLKRDTRHFAKRQLTWFRREEDVIWVDKSAFDHNESRILDHILEVLKEKGIG